MKRHIALKRGKGKPTHTTRDGRLILSPRDWKWMKEKMWADALASGVPLRCRICNKPIAFYEEFQSDHIKPRGMGGGKRDDRPENIQPSHSWCNAEKGGKRNA